MELAIAPLVAGKLRRACFWPPGSDINVQGFVRVVPDTWQPTLAIVFLANLLYCAIYVLFGGCLRFRQQPYLLMPAQSPCLMLYL